MLIGGVIFGSTWLCELVCTDTGHASKSKQQSIVEFWIRLPQSDNLMFSMNTHIHSTFGCRAAAPEFVPSISIDVRDESSLHDLTLAYAMHVRVGEDLVSTQGNFEQMKAELDVLTQTSAFQRAPLATTLDRMHTESLTMVGMLEEDEGVIELKPMQLDLFFPN